LKSGSLKLLEPSGLVQACNGITLALRIETYGAGVHYNITVIPNFVKIGQLMQKLEAKCIDRTTGQGVFLTPKAIFMCHDQLNDKKSLLLSRCHRNEPDVTAHKISIYSTNV